MGRAAATLADQHVPEIEWTEDALGLALAHLACWEAF